MAIRRKNSKPTRSVTIELDHSHLHVVIQTCNDGQLINRCQSIPWRDEMSSLTSELGVKELGDALSGLVRSENLTGQTVTFLLTGQHSVTRTATGTEQHVTRRLDELRLLCSRYLLLGHGRKISSQIISTTDGGKSRAVFSVANERTLRAICAAAERAGLKVGSIRTTFTCLPAFVAANLPEHQRSGVLVYPRESGIDISIIENGQLLLDVHPVNGLSKRDLGKFISERSELIQRFFQRNAAERGSRLESMLVCSTPENVAYLTVSLAGSGMNIIPVCPNQPDADAAQFDGRYASGLGVHAIAPAGTAEFLHPNLLDALEFSESRPMWHLLAASAWPLAASVLLAVALFGLQTREESLLANHREVMNQHVDMTDELAAAAIEFDDESYRLRQLTLIKQGVRTINVAQILGLIGASLTEETQITGFHLDVAGTLRLNGVCDSEEAIFDFVENVGRLPLVEKAALESTSRTADDTSGVVEFNVEAYLRNRVQVAEGTSSWPDQN